MAKLRDERFSCPGGLNSDSVTCLNLIMVKQLSNGACQSILFKLVMAILRNESSEALRRRYGFRLSVKKSVIFHAALNFFIAFWPFILLCSANMPCFLAIFSTVSMCSMLMFQQQFCKTCFLMSKMVKIWISRRCVVFKILLQKFLYFALSFVAGRVLYGDLVNLSTFFLSRWTKKRLNWLELIFLF